MRTQILLDDYEIRIIKKSIIETLAGCEDEKQLHHLKRILEKIKYASLKKDLKHFGIEVKED